MNIFVRYVELRKGLLSIEREKGVEWREENFILVVYMYPTIVPDFIKFQGFPILGKGFLRRIKKTFPSILFRKEIPKKCLLELKNLN